MEKLNGDFNTNVEVIDWVRHAESCANLLEKKIVDKYTNEVDDKKYDEFISGLVEQDNVNYGNQPYENFISDFVRNKLDRMVTKKHADVDQMKRSCRLGEMEVSLPEESWKTTIDTHKESITKKAIQVRDKIIKSRWLFHPTLSYIGVQQAIGLGQSREFGEIIADKNVFITSASVRTIMTAVLSLQFYQNMSSIIVVPFITERLNEAGEFDLDNANIGISPDIIDDIVAIMKKWLIDNGVIEPEAFVNVDTSFYKEMCAKYSSENPLISNLPMFKNYILNELYHFTQPTLSGNRMNILAYSHGYFISKLLSNKKSTYKSDHHPNVSIFRETSNEMNILMGGIYIRRPSNIESTMEREITDEKRNICSLNSLRGAINKRMIENFKLKGIGGGGRKRTSKKRLYKRKTSRTKRY